MSGSGGLATTVMVLSRVVRRLGRDKLFAGKRPRRIKRGYNRLTKLAMASNVR